MRSPLNQHRLLECCAYPDLGSPVLSSKYVGLAAFIYEGGHHRLLPHADARPQSADEVATVPACDTVKWVRLETIRLKGLL